GYPTLTVKASGAAGVGNPSNVLLNSTMSGIPVGPMAFDVQAYQNGVSVCGGYGAPINFSLYVDTPSDCSIQPDNHFSYTTLTMASNCSDNPAKTTADALISNPSSLGTTSVVLNSTTIRVCHGARLPNPDLMVGIGRPFIVPLIAHTDALVCSS